MFIYFTLQLCLYCINVNICYNPCHKPLDPSSERLKREEQGRLEQEKWRRRMEGEAAEAQEQLTDLGLLVSELRSSLSNREKEITTLQTRYIRTDTYIHTYI